MKSLSLEQHFPYYKSMGAIGCHGNQFWSNLRKNLMQLFLHTSEATYKIWSRMPNLAPRHSSSKEWMSFGTQAQVTSKWLVRSGRNLNPSEIFLLSLLPASLKMIQLKVKELFSRHFLHCKSLGKIFITQGWVTPTEWSDLTQYRTHPRFYDRPRYRQVWSRSYQKWSHYPRNNISPIICQRMPWKPEFWSNLPQMLMQPFNHPSDANFLYSNYRS